MARGLDAVRELARTLPGIEESLKFRGKLLACPAIDKSAEPDSLVVRIGFDQRAELIATDPDVYYVTDHYVKYPSVLVRMSRIHPDSLRGLLAARGVTPGKLTTAVAMSETAESPTPRSISPKTRGRAL